MKGDLIGMQAGPRSIEGHRRNTEGQARSTQGDHTIITKGISSSFVHGISDHRYRRDPISIEWHHASRQGARTNVYMGTV